MTQSRKQQIEAQKAARRQEKQAKRGGGNHPVIDKRVGINGSPTRIFEKRGIEYHPCVHYASDRADRTQCRKACTDSGKVGRCDRIACPCEWRICPLCARDLGALKAGGCAAAKSADASTGLCAEHTADRNFNRGLGKVPAAPVPAPELAPPSDIISPDVEPGPIVPPYEVVTAPVIKMGSRQLTDPHRAALRSAAQQFAAQWNGNGEPVPSGAPVLLESIAPCLEGRSKTKFSDEELLALARETQDFAQPFLLKVLPYVGPMSQYRWQLIDTNGERLRRAALLNQRQLIFAIIAGVADDTECYKRDALRAAAQPKPEPATLASVALTAAPMPTQPAANPVAALAKQFGIPAVKGVRIVGVVMEIPPALIKPLPDQPRGKDFDEGKLKELGMSMKTIGQRIPILVAFDPRDKQQPIQLVAGERRLRAAQLVGIPALNAISTNEPKYADQFVSAVVENFGREDCGHLEIARALKRVLELQPSVLEQSLYKLVGRSEQWVREHLSILRLPKDVVARMEFTVPEGSRISYLTARELTKITDASARKVQSALAARIIEEQISQGQVRTFIRTEIAKMRRGGVHINVAQRDHTPRRDHIKLVRFMDRTDHATAIWLEQLRQPNFPVALFASRQTPLSDLDALIDAVGSAKDKLSEIAEVLAKTKVRVKTQLKLRST